MKCQALASGATSEAYPLIAVGAALLRGGRRPQKFELGRLGDRDVLVNSASDPSRAISRKPEGPRPESGSR